MDATDRTPTAAETLRRLNPDELRRRLAELDAERDALRVLLRSIEARERALRRKGAST